MSGSNSVVECQLPKLDVAGSSPVSRSTFQGLLRTHSPFLHLIMCASLDFYPEFDST